MRKDVMIGISCGFGGLLVGSVVTFIVEEWRCKKILEEAKEEEMQRFMDFASGEEPEEYFEEPAEELDRDSDQCMEMVDEEQIGILLGEVTADWEIEESNVIRKKLKRNFEKTTSYAQMYQNEKVEAETETEEEPEDDLDEDDEAELAEEEIANDLEELDAFGGEGRIVMVTDEQMIDLNNLGIVDFTSLLYDFNNAAYLEESMEMVDEEQIGILLGEVTADWELDRDSDQCHVLNKDLQTVYTIDKMFV